MVTFNNEQHTISKSIKLAMEFSHSESCTFDDCLTIIRLCAEEVASVFLAEKGEAFQKVSDTEDIFRIYERAINVMEREPNYAAAQLMQIDPQFGLRNDYLRSSASTAMCYRGEDCFWETLEDARGDSHYLHETPKEYPRVDYALWCYQIAAGLNWKNDIAHRGVICICRLGYGYMRNAEIPYVVVLESLYPTIKLDKMVEHSLLSKGLLRDNFKYK